MLKSIQFIVLVIVVLFNIGCKNSNDLTIKVYNTLPFERTTEIIEISMQQLGIQDVELFELLGVVDAESNKHLLCQYVDKDGDGVSDVLIFQPDMKAGSEKEYKLLENVQSDSVESKVYSRFVPERTDDYAWENDKVAFRTFGPTAQKMAEEGNKDGTLSSGIDCWLKRVDYPVINIRYKGFLTNPNYYHSDHGNGFDPFHVGKSRGCGGIGVYIDNELFVSKNFTDYKTLSNGPLRTSFTLAYADWKAGDNLVKEQKHISLDLGSNLTCITENIEGVDEITIGITLHEKEGETWVDTLNYCFTYWEPMRDSELGTAVVINPKYYVGYTKVVTDEKDLSQLLVHLKVIDGKVKYKTGFNWKKSNQFENKDAWHTYLKKEVQCLQSPLLFTVENK